MMPISPALATSEAACRFVYPRRASAGMRMPPIAATVAGPEPEIEEKMSATRIVVSAIPVFR